VQEGGGEISRTVKGKKKNCMGDGKPKMGRERTSVTGKWKMVEKGKKVGKTRRKN